MSVIKKRSFTAPQLKNGASCSSVKKPDLTKVNENEEMGYNYYGPKPAWCYGYFSTIGSNWFFM